MTPFKISETKKCAYFYNEVDVGGEGLHSVETGDESDGQEALLIHLPPQEEVPLQVVQAEVVLTTGGRETRKHVLNFIQTTPANQLSLVAVFSLRIMWEGLRHVRETNKTRQLRSTHTELH